MTAFLPFTYALRNLMRDPARFAQTLLGTALVVMLIMGAYSLNDGMTSSMKAAGHPENVMLLGAGSEESVQRSEVSEQAAGIAEASIYGVHTRLDNRAVSPEIYHMAEVDVPGEGLRRAQLRGVLPQSLFTHPDVTILEGRFCQPGELLVGRMAWRRLGVPEERLAIGSEIRLEGVTFKVSGIFANPGTVTESEIWLDLNELRTLAQRESVSTVVVRLNEGTQDDVDLFTKQRFDLELAAISEVVYYEKLASFYQPIRIMTWITALLIALSAVFGGLNTLYAAFASRVSEIATLQALGFSRLSVLVSFVQESLLTCLAGTLLGASLAVLLLSERVISMGGSAFRMTIEPEALYAGVLTGTLLGLIGTIPPAIRCLGPALPTALRETA